MNYKGISLGNDVVLNPGVVLTTDMFLPESGIDIGDGTWINRNTLIQGTGGVSIGKRVLFGPSVIVWTSGHKYDAPGPIQGQELTYGKIEIGDGAWIAAGAIILPGRKIGEGAIIGAGSVVTKDVDKGEIVAGNPAVVIGKREI